jgi:DNA-binding NarL/FixJ family response regulator
MPTENSSSTLDYRLLRVLIADDMPQVRQDLRTLLQLTDEMEIVGEAANGLEAIAQAEALRPDVVVMDLEMPEMGGIAATREIKNRGLAGKVVILSIHADCDSLQEARQAGADIFIDKASRFHGLISAIVGARQYTRSHEED